jgi:hypothetical protein
LEIFVCYARADRTYATEVCRELERRRISYFLDEAHLQSGDQYRDRLRDAIISCEEVFLIISEQTLRRTAVLLEIGAAWGRHKRITPLLVNGVCPALVSDCLGLVHAQPLSDISRVVDDYERRRAARFEAIQGPYAYCVYSENADDDAPCYEGSCSISYERSDGHEYRSLRFNGERTTEQGETLTIPKVWYSVWCALFSDGRIRSDYQFLGEDASRQSIASLAYDDRGPRPMIYGRVFRCARTPEALRICFTKVPEPAKYGARVP